MVFGTGVIDFLFRVTLKEVVEETVPATDADDSGGKDFLSVALLRVRRRDGCFLIASLEILLKANLLQRMGNFLSL